MLIIIVNFQKKDILNRIFFFNKEHLTKSVFKSHNLETNLVVLSVVQGLHESPASELSGCFL